MDDGPRAVSRRPGSPRRPQFRTRHELALEMLDEHGALLPHAWVAGDDEMGRPTGFRLELSGRGERYLLAVPSNTLIRDIDAPPPEYAGRGTASQEPVRARGSLVRGAAGVAWTTIEVRDGEKGPLAVDVVKRRVQARTPTGGTGPEEVLFITRERQADGTFKHDYYLSNAGPEVPLKELARVAKAAHRVEKAQADYPSSRRWVGTGGSVTIDVTALLELAAWCRQRLDDPTGGAACPTPPDAPRPPAPDADDDRVERPAAGVGAPAGRPAEATPRTARPTPRPAPRGQRPKEAGHE